MNPDDIIIWLIRIATPPQTLFILIYGLWLPWWRSRAGQAIFSSSLALALLLNLSLLQLAVGPYPGHEWVGVGVFALVTLGAWLKLTALLVEMLRPGHTAHNGFDSTPRRDRAGD